MSPDERDRLVRVEAGYEHLAGKVEGMDKKLDELLQAAAMGRGAWWLLLKLGGLAVAFVTAAVWVWDRLQKFLGH